MQTLLKKIVWKKGKQCYSLQDLQKCETHGELFLTGVYLLANTNENRKMLDERNH